MPPSFGIRAARGSASAGRRRQRARDDRGLPRGLRPGYCRRRPARAEAARQARGDSSRASDRREALSGRVRSSSGACVREAGTASSCRCRSHASTIRGERRWWLRARRTRVPWSVHASASKRISRVLRPRSSGGPGATEGHVPSLRTADLRRRSRRRAGAAASPLRRAPRAARALLSGARGGVRGRKVVWLHNASVGELLAARPLVRQFRDGLEGGKIVLSTTSLAGRSLARGRRGDAAVLLPLDFPSCVARALDAIRPALFVFTETEIWPNLLRGFARRGVPAVMLFGSRVSSVISPLPPNSSLSAPRARERRAVRHAERSRSEQHSRARRPAGARQGDRQLEARGLPGRSLAITIASDVRCGSPHRPMPERRMPAPECS